MSSPIGFHNASAFLEESIPTSLFNESTFPRSDYFSSKRISVRHANKAISEVLMDSIFIPTFFIYFIFSAYPYLK